MNQGLKEEAHRDDPGLRITGLIDTYGFSLLWEICLKAVFWEQGAEEA